MAGAVSGLLMVGRATARADCGTQYDGDGNPIGCIPCGTNWGPWQILCPGPTNPPSVTPTSICQNYGAALSQPLVVSPGYTNGLATCLGTNDCGNVVSQSVPIICSVSGVIWTNFSNGYTNLPAVLMNSFSADAYVLVTNNPSTNCSSPGWIKAGTCSWCVSTYSTNCTGGFYTLTNGTITPTNGYVGTSFAASASAIASNAMVKVTAHCPCGTNADTYATNFVAPILVSNWWTVVVGSYSTNGTGLSVSFMPTNSGCGTVTFGLAYSNNISCDPNIHRVLFTTNFDVAQVTTNCTEGTVHLGASSAVTNLNFGPGASVNLSVTNNNITNVIVVATNWPCGDRPSGSGTNFVAPIIVSNWWTASVGSYVTSGTGLSARFTPTNGGCGSVTFNLAYSNNIPCDTNVYYPSLTLNFSVAQLNTNCTAGVVGLGNSSAASNFCFGSAVSLSVTNNNITNSIVVTTHWPSCSTNVDTYVTNLVTPAIFSNTWTLNIGSFNTNGNGMSVSFAPTNAGSGTVIFSEYYTNNTPCDTNVYSASLTVPFNVLLALNIVDGNTNPISSANNNNVVIVGQNIVLSAITANSCSETWSNYQWTVDGTTETNFHVSQDAEWTNGYPQPLTITTNSSIFFFWVDAGSKQVSCSAMCGGVSWSTNVTYSVVRPTISVNALTGTVVLGHNSYGSCLCFGVVNPPTDVGILFTNSLTMPAGTNYNNGHTNYSTRWIQLITSNPATITTSNSVNDVVVHSCQTVGTVLDTRYPYPPTTLTSADDSPSIALWAPNEIAASDKQDSKMWLMFKPDNGNWVPLWITTWNCTGAAVGFGNKWSLSGPCNISVLSSIDSGATYPVWANNSASFQYDPPINY